MFFIGKIARKWAKRLHLTWKASSVKRSSKSPPTREGKSPHLTFLLKMIDFHENIGSGNMDQGKVDRGYFGPGKMAKSKEKPKMSTYKCFENFHWENV